MHVRVRVGKYGCLEGPRAPGAPADDHQGQLTTHPPHSPAPVQWAVAHCPRPSPVWVPGGRNRMLDVGLGLRQAWKPRSGEASGNGRLSGSGRLRGTMLAAAWAQKEHRAWSDGRNMVGWPECLRNARPLPLLPYRLSRPSINPTPSTRSVVPSRGVPSARDALGVGLGVRYGQHACTVRVHACTGTLRLRYATIRGTWTPGTAHPATLRHYSLDSACYCVTPMP